MLTRHLKELINGYFSPLESISLCFNNSATLFKLLLVNALLRTSSTSLLFFIFACHLWSANFKESLLWGLSKSCRSSVETPSFVPSSFHLLCGTNCIIKDSSLTEREETFWWWGSEWLSPTPSTARNHHYKFWWIIQQNSYCMGYSSATRTLLTIGACARVTAIVILCVCVSVYYCASCYIPQSKVRCYKVPYGISNLRIVWILLKALCFPVLVSFAYNCCPPRSLRSS